ncbi:MAG TPA: calcium-binding protein [Methylophilaceae bacterium]|nr:calcium-binding protein [Methylophilaceae bacterium]
MANFEFESNNTALTANTGLFGSLVGGQLNATNDVDFFKFTLKSSELLNFNFTPPEDAASDAFTFSVLDSGLNVLYTTTSGAEALNYERSSIAGTYYVAISANGNNLASFSGLQYGITVTTLPSTLVLGEGEFNGDIANAKDFEIGLGAPLVQAVNLPNQPIDDLVIGALANANDKDYFHFQVGQTGTYTFKFNATPVGEPDPVDPDPLIDPPGTIREFFKISILDSSGTTVLVSHYVSATPDGGFIFDFGADVTGDYYVLIENGGSTTSQNTQQYKFEIDPTELGETATVTLHGEGLKDYLLGSSGSDYIEGRLGNDILIGLDGNDKLDGGAGIDTLKGGSGYDTYFVDNSADLVIENSGDGVDKIVSSVNITALAKNVENLKLADAVLLNNTKYVGAIIGTGNTENNIIVGNQLANSLIGLAGDDTLDGGLNDPALTTKGDALAGGIGDDTYYVNNKADTISELVNQGIDTVYARVDFTLSSTSLVENLILIDEATYGTGNGLDNIIQGNNNGADGLGTNQLKGLGGNDTIYGGGGNDAIIGGAGNDELHGDSGADTFVFDTALSTATVSNVDLIADFEAGIDHIFLASSIFTKLVGPAGNDYVGELSATNFVIGAAATTTTQYIIYDQSTGNLFYDVDGNTAINGKAAILFANVGANTVISHEDFTVLNGLF